MSRRSRDWLLASVTLLAAAGVMWLLMWGVAEGGGR